METPDFESADVKNIVVRWVSLSPAIGRELVDINVNFRNIRTPRIRELADAITRGEWEVNGETIKFSPKGELIDGFHRCHAVVLADRAVIVLAVFGVKSYNNIDTGASRPLADILKIKGYPDVKTLSTTCTWAWKLTEEKTMVDFWHKRPTHPQSLRFLSKHQKVLQSEQGRASRCRQFLPVPTMASFLFHLRMNGYKESRSDVFVKGLADGIGLEEGDALLAVRNRLIRNKGEVSVRRMKGIEILAVLIKGWNFWVEGRYSKVLSWRGVGEGKEDFPTLIPFKDL